MTVRELIEDLGKVEDKSVDVCVFVDAQYSREVCAVMFDLTNGHVDIVGEPEEEEEEDC